MQTDTDGWPCRNTDTTKLTAAVCNFVNPIIIVCSEIHCKAHEYTLWAESRNFERKPGGTHRNRWTKGLMTCILMETRLCIWEVRTEFWRIVCTKSCVSDRYTVSGWSSRPVASGLDFLRGGRQTEVSVRIQKLASVNPNIKSLTTKPIKTLRLLLCLK